MKKYILTTLILAGSLGITFAQPMPKNWQQDIDNYTQRQLNKQKEFKDKKTMESSFVVEIPVTKQYFPLDDRNASVSFENSQAYRTHPTKKYPSTVGCKAYAIDQHWLMAGASCLWNARQTFIHVGQTWATGLVEIDESKTFIKVNGEPIKMEGNLFAQPRFTLLPHVILVHIPENTATAKKIKTLSKPEILAFVLKEPTAFPYQKCFINSSRFGLNINGERTLKEYDFQQGTVRVHSAWNDYAGLSTDPIFFLSNGKVLWFGFNNGITEALPGKKWHGKSSDDYVLFNPSDISFIKKILKEQDPAALKRLAPRMHIDTLTK